MENKKSYPFELKKNIWKLVFSITVIISLVLVFIKLFLIPNMFKFISWFVPNFWTMLGYIFILWFIYKLFTWLWQPVKSILGKWSYLILIITVIYVIMQIN